MKWFERHERMLAVFFVLSVVHLFLLCLFWAFVHLTEQIDAFDAGDGMVFQIIVRAMDVMLYPVQWLPDWLINYNFFTFQVAYILNSCIWGVCIGVFIYAVIGILKKLTA